MKLDTIGQANMGSASSANDRSGAVRRPAAAISEPGPMPAPAAGAYAAQTRARARGDATRRLQERLNEDATAGQAVVGYLDRLGEAMREVAGTLRAFGGTDGQAGSSSAATAYRIVCDELQATWADRHLATGGRLDAELRVGPPGSARLGVRVPRLASAANHPPVSETLVFHAAGGGMRAVAVELPAGATPTQTATRCDDALRANGIGVQATPKGELVFTVDEADGPALLASLRVSGEGCRYPAGEGIPLTLEAIPGVFEPRAWHLGDARGRAVAQAQLHEGARRVHHAHTVAREQHEAARLAARRSLGAFDARSVAGLPGQLADTFGKQSTLASFQRLALLAPLVGSARAEHVRALLAP